MIGETEFRVVRRKEMSCLKIVRSPKSLFKHHAYASASPHFVGKATRGCFAVAPKLSSAEVGMDAIQLYDVAVEHMLE